MKLEIKNINKSFDDKKVLKDVSFTINSGKAMGFLGRNGAGKTTVIRSIMNVFNTDSGEILLDGKTFRREEHRIGYLPEERGMYGKIKILQQLIYFGELKGLTKEEAKESALNWLRFMNLEDRKNDNLDTLSKGNQQKVQIIQAIIDDPEILILDEPFSGLDPVNSQVFKDIIHDFIGKQRIVIFSSHQMGYVEEFCDDITFIKDGRIILSDNLDKVKQEFGQDRYRINTNLSYEEMKNMDKNQNYEVDRKSLIVKTHNPQSLLKTYIDRGIEIKYFSNYQPSLEDIFIYLDKKEEEKYEII